MFIKVTVREAAHLLAQGHMVWDGCDRWAGGIQLDKPRGCKARHLRKLERKLAGPWYADGWYIIRKA